MFKKLVSVIAAAALAAALSGAALALTVEQTQVVLPELDVYIYEDGDSLSGLSAEDVTATLGGEPLRTESLSLSDRGIYYIYMLDVSASIPESYFDAVRDAITAASARLRSQDVLTLMTFGNDVNMVLRGGESAEQVRAALDTLSCTDSRTALYDAMDTLVETASQTEGMRRIAVIVSDGIDDAEDGMTREMLEARLINSGIAVNALCLDSTAEAAAGDFRSFIHISGGELYLFGPESAAGLLDDLLERLTQGWLLELSAPTNIVSGESEELVLDFGGLASASVTLTPSQWIPDETAPEVKSAGLDEESGELRLTFSEDVSGADDPACYTAEAAGGEAIEILSARYEEGSLSSVILTLGSAGDASSMTLSAAGPVDISMEKNPLKPYSHVIYLGISAAPSEVAAPAEKEPLLPTGVLIAICAGALVVVAAIAALLFLSSAKRKQKAAERKEKKKNDPEDKTPKPARGSAVFIFEDKDKK